MSGEECENWQAGKTSGRVIRAYIWWWGGVWWWWWWWWLLRAMDYHLLWWIYCQCLCYLHENRRISGREWVCVCVCVCTVYEQQFPVTVISHCREHFDSHPSCRCRSHWMRNCCMYHHRGPSRRCIGRQMISLASPWYKWRPTRHSSH